MRKIDLLKAMRTFVTVADKQSFTEASRELNIVASAVSKQVSDLEAHFSTQLLYRTTRAMHLTGEGDYYLEQFREILGRIDSLESIASKRQQELSGNICISAPQGSSSLGYLQRTSEFIKQNPQVRISWLFLNRFVNMVEEGVDMSIRIGKLDDSNLIARQYAAVSIKFVASPDYIQRHGAPVHPKELSHHQCVLDNSNRQPGRWRYHDCGTEKTVQVNPFIQANDGEICARFAADGHGIAYIPTFLSQGYLDTGELVPVMPDFEFEPLPVSLVFPANRLMNPALRALIDFLLVKPPA